MAGRVNGGFEGSLAIATVTIVRSALRREGSQRTRWADGEGRARIRAAQGTSPLHPSAPSSGTTS